jgi:hypothetical protein
MKRLSIIVALAISQMIVMKMRDEHRIHFSKRHTQLPDADTGTAAGIEEQGGVTRLDQRCRLEAVVQRRRSPSAEQRYAHGLRVDLRREQQGKQRKY